MTCRPELVTGYVDGALGDDERAEIEAHLASCPACREQAESEGLLRAAIKDLPQPTLPPGLETRVAAALRAGRRRSPMRFLLPLAAGLLIFGWVRGMPGFVALEVARDHAKCFSKREVPALVWSDDPATIGSWFEAQGTRMPVVPATAAGLDLVGARYCPLGDRSAAHLYYADRNRHLSIFVVPGPVRFEGSHATSVRGRSVRFIRSAGATVALVSEAEEAVDVFAQTFNRSLARHDQAGGCCTAPP